MKFEIKNHRSRPVIGICRRIDSADVGKFIPETFGVVGPYFESEGMKMTGPPVAIFYGTNADGMDVAAGAPVAEVTATSGDITELELAAGRVASTMYIGPYDRVSAAWEEFVAELSAQGETTTEPCWEEYITDPSNEPDSAKWQTLLVQPLSS
jgi:effector-binding domain-containing protein